MLLIPNQQWLNTDRDFILGFTWSKKRRNLIYVVSNDVLFTFLHDNFIKMFNFYLKRFVFLVVFISHQDL